MAKFKDITGQRFGRLVALEVDEERNKQERKKGVRSYFWKCLCDCGERVTVNIGNLSEDGTQSCGCLRRKDVNLIGETFGRLTVVSAGEDYIEKWTSDGIEHTCVRRTWNCICECGKMKNNILEKHLKAGYVKSCGCLILEIGKRNKELNRKFNVYDLSGGYGIGFDSNGKQFIFDLCNYEKIKKYNWHVKYDGYVEAHDENNNYISLHRLIFNFPDFHIDHINHNPSDNRVENLRLVSREQNQANTKLRIDNTSGVKGVYYDKRHNRWMAYLQVAHQTYTRGFQNKQDAIEYRKHLEEKYQGEYSYDNSMKINDNIDEKGA